MPQRAPHHRPEQDTAPAAPSTADGLPRVRHAERPDHEVRRVLRLLELSGARRGALRADTVERKRESWRRAALALGRAPSMHAVTQRTIDGPRGPIELRIFVPTRPGASNTPRPAFLWCHGGGFVVGGLDSADAICRSIACAAGCITIAVSYRLAPEHDLLAGREDFLAALEWVAAQGAELGIDTTRLAIGGDSAGGNISAAVAQAWTQRGHPPLRLQVLVYPATDIGWLRRQTGEATVPPALAQHTGLLVQETLALLGDKLDAVDDPWVSPALTQDLDGLPPAVMVTAGYDGLCEDGLSYAARLRAAGVPVELLHYPGQIHGFLNFELLFSAARSALHHIAAALSAAYQGALPANRTLEIADDAEAHPPTIVEKSMEWAYLSMTLWLALERFVLTVSRPRAAYDTPGPRAWPRTLSAHIAWARGNTAAWLPRLVEHQTY